MKKRESQSDDQQVTISAAKMSLGTGISRILGFIRDLALAGLFPVMVRDAFVVAFRLPNMFRRLLGEGSLSVSFIPVFVSEKELNGVEQARNLANSVFTLLLIVSATLSILGIIFIEPMINLMVSGDAYQAVTGKVELTVTLARIMFAYLFLVTTYAYYMAILNALKSFFIPAMAPALFNLTFIIFAFVTYGFYPQNYELLAWAVIIGGIIQVAVTGYKLFSMGFLPQLSSVKMNPQLKTIFKNMIPGMIGLGILQLMSLVNIYYASELSEGSHSYIYFADRILELPNSIIAVSLSVALLPTLSKHWANQDLDKMKETVLAQLKNLFFLSLPCALGMYLLAHPIVTVLFKRGQFIEADVIITANIIKEYAFLLLAISVIRILATSFYAIKNTWVPAFISALSLVFHVIMAPVLMQKYGLYGLVGSTILSGYFNLIILSIFYKKFLGSFPLFHLLKSISVYLVPLFFMSIWVYYANIYIPKGLSAILPEGGTNLISLAFNIICAAVIYFTISHKMKIEESSKIISLINRKLKRS
ncbi:MAG: murein biosynthesis integral membrane protein MurJ [Bdellovibrionaceae bacterium]|nr:murein biosynthesis integral membrane protein MurJ [Pseudobdellovibrionaceae bacterium]